MKNFIEVDRDAFESVHFNNGFKFRSGYAPDLDWREAHITFTYHPDTGETKGYKRTSSWGAPDEYALHKSMVSPGVVHAYEELNHLFKHVPDAVVRHFYREIMDITKAFAEHSGSGASAPFYRKALVDCIDSLLDRKPLLPILGTDDEWVDISGSNGGEPLWQNRRCGAVFKNADGSCNYIDGIVFREPPYFDDTDYRPVFTGNLRNEIKSSVDIVFPFKPKSFTVDVWREPYVEDRHGPREANSICTGPDEKEYVHGIDDTETYEEAKQYFKTPYESK